MDKFLDLVARNRAKIYFSIILIFFFAGVYYGFRGYQFHQYSGPVNNSNDLLGKVFSPFVLGIIRFVIVMMLGIFIAMVLVSAPLKRLKVLHFEAEFNELVKVQEQQINLAHFVSTILAENEVLIGKAIDSTGDVFIDTVEEIFDKYENFFSRELEININAQIWSNAAETPVANSDHQRLIDKVIAAQEENKKIISKKHFFGNRNVMVAATKYYDELYIIFIESDEHQFTSNDIAILRSILEYSKIVCDTVDLI